MQSILQPGFPEGVGQGKPCVEQRILPGQQKFLMFRRYFPNDESLDIFPGLASNVQRLMAEDGHAADILLGPSPHPLRSGVIYRLFGSFRVENTRIVGGSRRAAFQSEFVVIAQHVIQSPRLAENIEIRKIPLFEEFGQKGVAYLDLMLLSAGRRFFPAVPVEGKSHDLVAEVEGQDIGGIFVHQFIEIDVRVCDGDLASA